MDQVDVAARDGIPVANRQFMSCFAAGDASGLSGLYTDDAEIMPPGSETIRGEDQICSFWQGVIESGMAKVSLQTTEVDNEGDTAIETGRYTLENADGKEADNGNYLIVWKRIEDRWLIHRDIWNSTQ